MVLNEATLQENSIPSLEKVVWTSAESRRNEGGHKMLSKAQ
jgi:hypothetical protein